MSFGQPADLPRRGRAEPDPATNRRNADAMPDGEHIIGVLSPGGAAAQPTLTPQITVVLNWFDEVRQKFR